MTVSADPGWTPPTQPVGPATGLRYAGFWIRTLAYLIDRRAVDGQPIGPGRAIGRFFGLALSFFVFAIGVIWVAADGRKQGGTTSWLAPWSSAQAGRLGSMATSIALDGVGGQGVRVIAGVLGNLLARMGKQVTVLFDYDSSVRGSMSDAFVIFDDEPIANPVVEDADILLKLANRGHLRIQGRKVVTDLGLASPGDEQIPFAALGSQHFGKELFGNMIALGRLLRLAAVDYDERSIRESLPRRFVDENLAAIRFGFDLTDEEIAHLASEAPPSRFEMNAAASAPAPVRGLDAAYDTATATPTGGETG